MAVKARSYEAAKIVLWVLGTIAWLQIIGGLFGLFAGGFDASSQVEMTAMVAIKVLSAIAVLSGFVSLALVQMASANVHSAETNFEMLQILRETRRTEKQ